MGMLEPLTSAAKAADPLASNAALKRCSTQKLNLVQTLGSQTHLGGAGIHACIPSRHRIGFSR